MEGIGQKPGSRAGRWGALVRGWLAGGSGSRTSVQGTTQAWGRPASGTPAGFARVVAMCTGFSGINMKNRRAIEPGSPFMRNWIREVTENVTAHR